MECWEITTLGVISGGVFGFCIGWLHRGNKERLWLRKMFIRQFPGTLYPKSR